MLRLRCLGWMLLLAALVAPPGAQPSTAQSATAPPATTPPATAPPATAPPAIAPPAIGPPATAPPATTPPATTPPTIPPPVTAPPEDATLFASPTRKDRVGRIVVPVTINGQGPFRLIVDTGASYSTVSPQLAQTLGLVPDINTPFMLNGITGSARVPSVPIDHLQAGDLSFHSIRLPVIWAPIMAGADGILGAAGLKDERIMVEFDRNRVTIIRSHAGMPPRGYQRVHAELTNNGLLTIEVRVGGVRAQAVIDTGAERSLGNQALRDALRHWQNNRKGPQYTDVYGTTEDVVQGEIGVAPTISIGPLKMIDLRLTYGNFHIFEVWKMRDQPALILGMDVLGTVNALGIDFRNREIYFGGAYLGVG